MLVTAAQVRDRVHAATGHHFRVVKAAAEQRFALGVAYPANRLDIHGEYVDQDTVEKAAWGYLQDGGRQVGFQHTDGTTGHARVVESFVWRAPDWTTTDIAGNTQTVRKGDWVLGVLFDEPGWRVIKSGQATGWSIDGLGKRRPVARTEATLRE